MREFSGEIGGSGLFDFILRGQQSRSRGLPSFGNDSAPVVHGSEEFVGGFAPEISGREIKSGDGVQGYVFLVSGGFDVKFGHALDARPTFGQQSDLASVLQSGMSEKSNLGGSPI